MHDKQPVVVKTGLVFRFHTTTSSNRFDFFHQHNKLLTSARIAHQKIWLRLYSTLGIWSAARQVLPLKQTRSKQPGVDDISLAPEADSGEASPPMAQPQ